MREISPAVGLSTEDFLDAGPPFMRQAVESVRRQKRSGTRPRPSATLVDRGTTLDVERRAMILDAIAELVDENAFGRSDMCAQFADLLARALRHLGLPARAIVGEATYFSAQGQVIFSWPHAWVRVAREVIDGNVDSVVENLMVPDEVTVRPYWGPITEVPKDRYLKKSAGELPNDEDVNSIWWPELRTRLDSGAL